MEKQFEIPNDVQVEINNFKIKVTGPKGSLERDFYSPLFRKDIIIKRIDNKISISTESKNRKIKAMIGAIRAHVLNMFSGVKEGFEIKLKIVYMHFPFTIKVTGNEISVTNFLGEKNPRKTRVAGNCKVEIKGDEVVVTGINKEDVGETASNLEKVTRIKSRDRRVFQDGIFMLK